GKQPSDLDWLRCCNQDAIPGRETILRPSRLWRLPAGFVEGLELARAIGGGSPCRQSCGPHELAWGAGGVLRPLTHLIALVEQLDFLHLFERFIERELGVVKLRAQLCRRTFEIFPPLHRRLCVSGIGEMIRIVDASAILLGLYLPVEI